MISRENSNLSENDVVVHRDGSPLWYRENNTPVFVGTVKSIIGEEVELFEENRWRFSKYLLKEYQG